MSKAGEKIAAEIKKVQDELATRLVPNISDFARYGESASDTFSRLNQEVAATDAILRLHVRMRRKRRCGPC